MSDQSHLPPEALVIDDDGAQLGVLDHDDDGPSPNLPSAATTRYVYAIGRIDPRFPTLAVEKEFAQVAGRGETTGLTDREALRSLLGERQNRYLLRELCWAFTVGGVDTYVLQPNDPVDFDQLLDAVRPRPQATDIDVVIGVLGPLAPPELCNGLTLPIVGFDQIYSFDIDSLLSSIPRPKGMKADEFRPAAEDLFSLIAQMTDNAGATDADRALNYLSVRYPAMYHESAERLAEDASLTGVEVRPSPLSGARTIVDVVFSYTNRRTDVVDKRFVRVDVTEEFPFLVSKLAPYFDREL